MPKENPDTKMKSGTPFRKFEKLAKKIVRVPKDKAHQHKANKPWLHSFLQPCCKLAHKSACSVQYFSRSCLVVATVNVHYIVAPGIFDHL